MGQINLFIFAGKQLNSNDSLAAVTTQTIFNWETLSNYSCVGVKSDPSMTHSNINMISVKLGSNQKC